MNNIETIESFIDEALVGSDCFLVQFVVKPTHNYKLFLDSDVGFTLEKSIYFNRLLRKRIDESGLHPEGDYSLEVSSPGVDTPLSSARQFRKNIGRKIEIEFVDAERPMEEVRLLNVEEDLIIVDILPKSKRGRSVKKEMEETHIALNEIKKAVVQVEF